MYISPSQQSVRNKLTELQARLDPWKSFLLLWGCRIIFVCLKYAACVEGGKREKKVNFLPSRTPLPGSARLRFRLHLLILLFTIKIKHRPIINGI